MRATSKLPGFLALVALALGVGCQTLPTSTTFGIELVNAANHPVESLSPELTGGQPLQAGSYAPDELLIELSDEADRDAVLEGFTPLGEVRFHRRFAAVRLPAGMSLTDAHATLKQRPGIRSIELNRIHRPSAFRPEPDDPRFQEQWSHRPTEALRYWQSDRPMIAASNLIVAVLDTGLDVTHPEFAGRVVAPQNMILDENPSGPETPVYEDVRDLVGHGTHVAGIIGAPGNNALGVAGVSWDVHLMPVKVLGANGGTDFQVLQGIAYALGEDLDQEGSERSSYLLTPGLDSKRVRVINMSLGAYDHARRPAYADAFSRAREMGVVVVVSAGNHGSEVTTPANTEHALAVSSTSAYQLGGHLWEWFSSFSNRGERIGLAAPGGQILSTLPTYDYVDSEGRTLPKDYGIASGTSMASPYVAGVAALLIAQQDPTHESLSADFHDAVKTHLYATSDDLGAPGKDLFYGYGRVNVWKALTTPFPAPLKR